MGYYDVYHRAEVVATRRLTPHLLRVELGGEGLRGWSSSGLPDERLVLVLPAWRALLRLLGAGPRPHRGLWLRGGRGCQPAGSVGVG